MLSTNSYRVPITVFDSQINSQISLAVYVKRYIFKEKPTYNRSHDL